MSESRSGKKVVIDLFSGLGGWSEAFLRDYDVYRYDSDPWLREVPRTEIIDLSSLKVGRVAPTFLLLGSPPCLEFSRAYDAPRERARRKKEPFEPSLKLVEAFIEHRDRLRPEWWAMENVVGSIPDLTPLLGEPRQIIGPFVLWGNFPLLDLGKQELKEIRVHKKKAGDKYRHHDHRSQFRAKIP